MRRRARLSASPDARTTLRPRAPWQKAFSLTAALAAVLATVSVAGGSAGAEATPTGSLSGKVPGVVSAAAGPSAVLRGALAWVSGHALTISRPKSRHTLTLTPRALAWEPAWSHDGRWLSFFEVRSAYPMDGSTGALWVTSPEGGAALVVERASEAAWSPRADQLAFVSGGHLELATTSGHPSKLPRLRAFGQVERFAWSPTGRDLAVGTVVAGSAAHPGGESSLLIVPADGGRVRVVARSRTYGFEVASWWPDGHGIVYWKDTGFSSSVAADGLPLVSRALATGTVTTLATTLPYPEWVAWSKTGQRLVAVAGRDRVVWEGRKHLVVCDVSASRCHGVAQPSGTTSTDPAWGAGGGLYFSRPTGTSRFSMTAPPHVGGIGATPPFSWRATEAWANAGQVRVWTENGTAAGLDRAVSGASGGQAPTPTSTGLFFVRAGALWVIPTGSHMPARLARRLGPYGRRFPGYYGDDDWAATFAWHA